MAVAPEISRKILEQELIEVKDLAKSYEWDIDADIDKLQVTVKMRSHNGDPYIIYIEFDDYKEKPPFIDFIDPETGQIGTARAYPKTQGSTGDSFFHTSGPCICAPFSRKAYKETGPHPNWKFEGWMTSTEQNYDWSLHSNLAGMLLLIQSRIIKPNIYKGRMA